MFGMLAMILEEFLGTAFMESYWKPETLKELWMDAGNVPELVVSSTWWNLTEILWDFKGVAS